MSTIIQTTHANPAVAARARRLAAIGFTGLVIGAALFWFKSPWHSPLLNLLAILICFFGCWPMLRWLQRHEAAYPLLEILQLTLVPFYAFPLLTEHVAITKYPEEVLIESAELVLVFQLCAFFGGLMADRSGRSATGPRWWQEELLVDRYLHYTSYIFILPTLWLFVATFTKWTPAEWEGTLRAVFFGIGTICGFMQAHLWGSGHLPRPLKLLFTVNVLLQILTANLGLLLITSLVMLLIILVGYFTSARRVPWALALAALAFFALLHAGKHKMRDVHWGPGARQTEWSEVPAFYSEWIAYGLSSGLTRMDGEEAGTSSLLERASLFQIVCYAVDTVPERTPFLNGSSYAYVFPQVVPRFLWPDKPSPNASGRLLSVRLGILTESESETTSIGYGLIAESYVNFGFTGTAILALVLGWVARRIALATAHSPALSSGGIFRILCLAWCLNTEATLAVWLSSFYQACIAVYFPLWILRMFLR